MRAFAVLAHQGGWDEIFLFAIPVLVALAAVKFVERRNRGAPESSEPAPTEEDDDGA